MSKVTVDMELNVRTFNSSLKNATKAADNFSKNATKGFGNASGAFNSFIGNLGATAVTAAFTGITKLAGAVVDFGKSSIEAASKMEDLEVQFKTLTGSAGQAKKIMKDLTSFAASTPFQLEGLAKVSSQLLSFGFQVDEIQPKLKRIGDVAAASGTGLGELGLIFGQVSAAGKLTGERLLQLQERGIPILDALADATGKPSSAIRDMVSKGQIDFKTFEEAFNSLSDKGGFAFEGMIAKSKTFSGVVSTLSDNWTLFSAEVGKALLPIAKGLATFAIQSIQAFDVNIIKNWVQNGMLIAIDSTSAFLQNINGLASGTKILWNGFQIVFKAIANGFYTIITAGAQVGNWLDNFVSYIVDIMPDSLIPDGWKESLEENKEASNQFLLDVATANQEMSESIMTDFDDIGNAFEDNFVSEDQLANLQKRLDQAKNIVLKSNKEIGKEMDKDHANKKKVDSKKLQETSGFWSTHFGTAKDWTDYEVAYEKSTQKEKQANLKSSLSTISTLTSSNNKELFFIGKAASVANATIDGIAATQKALASAPPPFNFILAGLVGAASALNIANIASAQPPRYEQGGLVNSTSLTGDTNIIRANGGEMMLTKSQQSNLFQQINGGSFGNNTEGLLIQLIDAVSAQRNTSININGSEVFNAVREEVSRGRRLA